MNKILFISDLTLDIIVRKLINKLDNEQYDIDNIFGDLNILLQSTEVMTYDVIIIFIDPYFMKYSDDELNHLFDSIKWFRQTKFNGTIIINNFLDAYPSSQLYYASNVSNSFFDILQEGTNNTIVFDYISCINELSMKDFYNFTLGHLYQMPYSKNAIELISVNLGNLLKSLNTIEKKVIVLDCDNTLWGGILGEDGVNGIKCDLNASGIVYFHFQKFLLGLKNDGFLLCLCSKNNDQDVRDTFHEKSMPLKFSDFIATRINWNDKNINIIELSKELNLGLDSFIFIDDSDFETGAIQSQIPEVTTIQFYNDYLKLLELMELNEFKKKRVLADDKLKNQQYMQNKNREQSLLQHTNIENYIESLEIKFKYEINDVSNLERFSQLTEKTNQFNFNKIVYSVDNLRKMIESGNTLISLALSDKFGDYGIIGLIILRINTPEVVVENMIMSCRALGRRVEYKFWNYMKSIILEQNLRLTEVCFVSTQKNMPAKEFYEIISKEV